MRAHTIRWIAPYCDDRPTDPGAAPRPTQAPARGPRVTRWRPYATVAGPDGFPLVARVTAWTFRPYTPPRGGARGAAHYLARSRAAAHYVPTWRESLTTGAVLGLIAFACVAWIVVGVA